MKVRCKKTGKIYDCDIKVVPSITINSALLSAQNRVRLYWTNIANEPYGLFGDIACTIQQPKDKGILLRDVLEQDVPEKYYLSDKAIDYLKRAEMNERFLQNENDDKGRCVVANYQKGIPYNALCVASIGRNPKNPKSREVGLHTQQMLEPRFDGKTNCLTSVQKDNLVMQINPSKESGGKQPYQPNRIYHTNGISPCLNTDARSPAILVPEATTKGYAEVQPGDCFDATFPDSKTRRGRLMEDKSNCLTATKFDFMQLTTDYRIRRLTPKECSRLQTIPDWYQWGDTSDTQIYRMLGNGWTIEVIKYILSHAKP